MAREQELFLAEEHLQLVLSYLEQQRTSPNAEFGSWLQQVNMHLNIATQLINSIEAPKRVMPQTVSEVVVPSVVLQGDVSHSEELERPKPPIPHPNPPITVPATPAAPAPPARVNSPTPPKANVKPTGAITSTKPVDKKETKPPTKSKQTIADAYIAKAPTTTNESTHAEIILGERKQALKSIRKGLTVNDRLRFSGSLCKGNRDEFLSLVERIDNADSLPTALSILHETYKGDPSLPELQEFILLIERRFA